MAARSRAMCLNAALSRSPSNSRRQALTRSFWPIQSAAAARRRSDGSCRCLPRDRQHSRCRPFPRYPRAWPRQCTAAVEVGVRRFDASLAGTGGCPFAPGATGNWTAPSCWSSLGFATGIDIEALVALRADVEAWLPGERFWHGRPCRTTENLLPAPRCSSAGAARLFEVSLSWESFPLLTIPSGMSPAASAYRPRKAGEPRTKKALATCHPLRI